MGAPEAVGGRLKDFSEALRSRRLLIPSKVAVKVGDDRLLGTSFLVIFAAKVGMNEKSCFLVAASELTLCLLCMILPSKDSSGVTEPLSSFNLAEVFAWLLMSF